MASLETTRLGQSNMEITRVGIGTAPIGSTPEWFVEFFEDRVIGDAELVPLGILDKTPLGGFDPNRANDG